MGPAAPARPPSRQPVLRSSPPPPTFPSQPDTGTFRPPKAGAWSVVPTNVARVIGPCRHGQIPRARSSGRARWRRVRRVAP
jgi:hypothetical protein